MVAQPAKLSEKISDVVLSKRQIFKTWEVTVILFSVTNNSNNSYDNWDVV